MKGHPFLFKALPELLAKHPEVVIAVTGGGAPDYEEELRQLISDLGLDESVHFVGYTDNMPVFYRHVTWFVSPQGQNVRPYSY